MFISTVALGLAFAPVDAARADCDDAVNTYNSAIWTFRVCSAAMRFVFRTATVMTTVRRSFDGCEVLNLISSRLCQTTSGSVSEP